MACCFLTCGNGHALTCFSLKLPELPRHWGMLPEPQWKIEWLDSNGRDRFAIIRQGEKFEVSIPHTWANAVLAWPFWPEKGLVPGVFMPAGGLFPHDVSGSSILLSWKGGIDSVLYWELKKASFAEPVSKPSVPRLPWNFDWVRFRELLASESLNAALRSDPWLADWPSIAEKIWQSGFDKRRLVPQPRIERLVSVSPGPWIGTSPFAAPLFFDGTPSFQVRTAPVGSPQGTIGPTDTWVSSEGILRCNTGTWVLVANNK